ncbi:MAG: 6-phosphofructokinase [Alphaproteobacteria bacterium]|nr:6-phosphofructokinase [Alphaproteobacteria bacterium]
MRIGVLTSGGDAPGMNAAVVAVVRRALVRGWSVSAIHEGYAGLMEGRIADIGWNGVSHVQQLGGTVLGTARSPEFRTSAGRKEAVFHLVQARISRLVVVGGDGSLTGANALRAEWGAHIEALLKERRITRDAANTHPRLGLTGLVGSIDNDLWGTDRTIGCDTALHRIVDAVDTLTSTARSHQRSFVVEVMGRRAGFLALAASVCTGADHVLIPERPADDWEGEVCAALWRGRHLGRRKSIVLLAEGACDRQGKRIEAEALRAMIERELQIETRTTVLGHVQRGGTPSAYDRVQSTALGVAAVDRLVGEARGAEPTVMTTAGPSVVPRLLAECVRKTAEIATALDEGRFQAAVNARGPEFMELLAAHDTHGRPAGSQAVQRRLLLAHVGAPAPGMNAAIHAFVRTVSVAGHVPVLAHEGLRGLLEGRLAEVDVDGIQSVGATLLGTNRWRPRTTGEVAQLRKALQTHDIDGVVLVGGFGALEAAAAMRVPCAVVPATISNNVPGTEISVGADTAVNAICEAIDRLKQSAVGSRHRVFFVEVMGRRCGWLARAAGIGGGAELVYTDEEPPTLDRLRQDVAGLNAAMDAGRTVGIVLVADGVPDPYRAERLADLFRQESGGRFDTRVCVLGHLQQGGRPSPADRMLAVRLVQKAVADVLSGCRPCVVGLASGAVKTERVEHALAASDRDARRPTFPRLLASVTDPPGPPSA